MEPTIYSVFHQFICDKVGGYYEAKYLHKSKAFIGISSHAVTKAYKEPKNTPHFVIVAFADELEIPPYQLIQEFNLGIDKLYPSEINHHKREYEIQKMREEERKEMQSAA